ncbi:MULTISPECIES: lasso RiPP family leader peptide-containing protein [unclassified Sphingomonas]|nr:MULTISPECIES: lasso RiPP family leader peptide-containing protein [unclassified Sphingomonas]
MDNLINNDREPSEDSRLVYVKPELIDAGKIADVTLSNGNDSGSDGGYS